MLMALGGAGAQAPHPFGPAPGPASPAAPASGEPGWLDRLQAAQQEFHRSLATGLRALREEGSLQALFALLAIAFAYGVLHAAGPGHGKAVLSAYLAASDSAVKRGVVLAFLSSGVQALTAILAVGILAAVFGLLSRSVVEAAYILERISFLMIAGLGLYLVWLASGSWLTTLFKGRTRPPAHSGGTVRETAHTQGHRHHDSGQTHSHDHAHEHGHQHGHGHGPDCSHDDHIALPAETPIARDWRETAGVVLSIGIRPCQGAILVLLFSFASGIFWAGVLATLAMALGTAITVAVIAIMTIIARQSLIRMAAYRAGWPLIAGRAIMVAAGLFLLWTGLALALSPAPLLLPGGMGAG